MREIKYRAKSIAGDWHYGNISILKESLNKSTPAGVYISNSAGMPFAYQVRPETVGQFAGWKDRNRIDIYEGDILWFECEYENEDYFGEDEISTKTVVVKGLYVVKWSDSEGGFILVKTDFESGPRKWETDEYYEIKGNQYDNHDLLLSGSIKAVWHDEIRSDLINGTNK